MPLQISYFHATLAMASEAETDQSDNTNYKYKFGDKVFTYSKQCMWLAGEQSHLNGELNKMCLISIYV